MNTLEWAQRYAKMGWQLLPIRKGEKRTFLKDWPAKANNEPSFLQWFFSGEDNAIGVACGARSGVDVLDIDDPSFDVDKLNTLVGVTGSGKYHAYFRHHPLVEAYGNRVRFMEGCDIRTTAGYVVAPPSLHPSGGQYTWLNWGHPIAPWPDWLLDKMQVPIERETILEEDGHVPPGRQSDAMAAFAGWLRGQVGLGEEGIYELLRTFQPIACPSTPGEAPWRDGDLRLIAKSICRYEPGELPKSSAQLIDQLTNLITENPSKSYSFSFEEFMSQKESAPWLIQDLVPGGAPWVIFGAPKVGKSYLCMSLALAIANGEDWCGKKTTQANVLLLMLEDSWAETQKRLGAFLLSGDSVRVWKEKSFSLANDEHVRALMAEIRAHDIGLVIIDCLSRVAPGNENSSGDMAGHLNKLVDLTAGGVSVGVIHHSNKASNDPEYYGGIGSRMRGTSMIHSVMRHVVQVLRPGKTVLQWESNLDCNETSMEVERLYDHSKVYYSRISKVKYFTPPLLGNSPPKGV